MSMNLSLPIIILIFFLFLSHFPFLSLSFLLNQNITLSGDAYLRNNAIFLTQERDCLSLSPNSSSSASGFGSAVYVNPVRFLDSSTNSSASFSSRFSLSILPTPLCSFPDGFAFLIASDPESFTLSNSHIPLPNPSHNSPFSFIAVEFDTNFDSNLGDINDNHLGLNVNSPTSLTSVDFRSHGIVLKNGRKITAWIEYRDDSKTIRVWVGYSQTRPVNALLVAPMDLSKQFKEFMYVGFSASNGQGSALFIVDRWQFRTFGLLPSLSPVDTINEGADCFMCSSEDLNSDNSRFVDASERKKKSGEMSLVFGGLAAFACSGALILGFVSYTLIMKLRSRMCRGREIDRTCLVKMNRIPTRLSLGEIKLATMGFNQNRVVGEGGSATVYKGSLPSGVEVAVKRFEQGMANNRLPNPFTTEFATMVGCLRHKNLVQLHGWCCEANELVLVYEYLANGSLAKLLHETSPNSKFVIPWKKRLSIVLGVASALTYLHEECERQIIHRDVKTCNILLDAELSAKLGDFGLAEVYEHSSLTRIATIPAGTMGYLAPEYLYYGVPTVKTDVYSFGVVMLEVASGKRPVDEGGMVLVDWIWVLWGVRSLIEAADPRLMGNYDVVEMERMLMVGLFCVHPNNEKRPTVKEAVRILRGEAPLPVLPLRKPMVGIRPILSDDFEDLENPCADYIAFEEPAWMTPKSEFG